MKPNNSRKIDQIIKKSFLRRARRLIRLIQLNAPDIIICNEIHLMHKKLPAFGKGYLDFLEHSVSKDIAAEKNLLGICAEVSCNNSTEVNSEDDFQRCLSCDVKFRLKFAVNMKELEEMARMDAKENLETS